MSPQITAAPPPNRQQRRHGADSEPRFITAAELADRWGISRQHVYNLLRQGLPSVTIGRARRFRTDVVDAWIEAQG